MIRFFQFRLGAMLIAVTIVCVCLGFWQSSIAPYREQKLAIAELQELGASIKTRPANPYWMEKFVGEEDFVRVDWVDLSYQAIKNEDLAKVRNIAGLKNLTLKGCSITDDGLAQLRGMEKLERLDISNTVITGEGLRHVAAIPSLKILDLRRTRIEDESLTAITRLFELEELYVSHPITEEALPTIAKLPRLKRLHAAGTSIRPSSIPLLAGCPFDSPPILQRGYRNRDIPYLVKLPSLEKLDLQMWPTDDELAQIATLTQLTDLGFHGDKATIAGLKHLTALPRLRSLNIQGTDYDEAEIQLLVDEFELESLRLFSWRLKPQSLMLLKNIRSLRSLHITTPWVDPAFATNAALEFSRLETCQIQTNANWSYDRNGDVVSFTGRHTKVWLNDAEALAIHPEIQSISFQNNKHNPQKPKRPLLPLTTLKKLTHLRLFDCGIEASALIDLVEMDSVESLELGGNQLGDDALRYIVQMPRLKHLDLGHSQITDEGFSWLTQASALETLTLHSNALSEDCLRYLNQMASLKKIDLNVRYDHNRNNQIGVGALLRAKANLPGVEVTLHNPLLEYNGSREVVAVSIFDDAFTEHEALLALPTIKRISIQISARGRPIILPHDGSKPLVAENVVSDVARLSTLAKLPQLASLHWRDHDVDSAAFSQFAEIPQLTELHLAVGLTGLEALPEIAKLTKLQRLVLDFSVASPPRRGGQLSFGNRTPVHPVSDSQITQESFSQLTNLKQLTSLTVNSVKLEKGCLQAISLLPDLAFLNLQGTQIDDDELANLGRLPSLKSLHINNTQVTPTGVDTFRRQNPNCQLHW